MKAVLLVLLFTISFNGSSQSTKIGLDQSKLLIPILVKQDRVLAGDTFAQYRELKQMESVYLNSPLKDIYREQLKNIEQFLGLPQAGLEAMQLPALRTNYSTNETIPAEYDEICPAIDVIIEKGKTHRIIIWGEDTMFERA